MTKEEFKDIRMQYGFTQEEFGEVLGLSKSGVSNIENGTRAINKKHIRLIEYFMTMNKPDYKVTLGNNIKAARKAKKMTQPQLAALIDKHESSIRKYEKGLTDIPNEVIQKIAEVLDTTPGELLGIIKNEKVEDVTINKILVGRNIKLARKKRHLKQKELAEIIGYTESSISKYEQGLTEIPNSVIELIAKALQVSPLQLLGFETFPIIEEKEEPVDLTKISTKELLNEIERRCKA